MSEKNTIIKISTATDVIATTEQELSDYQNFLRTKLHMHPNEIDTHISFLLIGNNVPVREFIEWRTNHK